MSAITLKEAEKYYKKDKQGKLSDKVIVKEIKDTDAIVYGARSVNAILPSYLRKHTDDWDIYVDDEPKEVAQKMEKALDKRYGGNFFKVEPAKHENTYKIRSKVTNRGIADITLKENPVDKRTIGGINYAVLDYQVDRIKKTLSNEENQFRHKKDRETLQRIKIYKKKKGTKKSIPSLSNG